MLSGLKQKGGSLIGSGIQLLGLSHGLITGVSGSISDPANIPRAVLNDYTGYDMASGTWDQGKAIKSATIILVSFLVGKGIKYVAKH